MQAAKAHYWMRKAYGIKLVNESGQREIGSEGVLEMPSEYWTRETGTRASPNFPAMEISGTQMDL